MLEFANKREVTSADQLSPHQAEQLRACGNAYDGSDLSAAELLTPGDDGESVLNSVELWDVVDDDVVVYEAWFYQKDSGAIFTAGTTEIVAEIIQSSLECDDEELKRELGMAMVQAELLDPADSEYERYRDLLDQEA
jgi:hypothetical protein